LHAQADRAGPVVPTSKEFAGQVLQTPLSSNVLSEQAFTHPLNGVFAPM